MTRRDDPVKVGEWLVEPALLRICRTDDLGEDRIKRLEPKAMSLLMFLVQRAGDVVSREELFEQVWEGRSVVDETLTRVISMLRQSFGDRAQSPRYIETIPSKGYRLIATVEVVEAVETERTEQLPEVQTHAGSPSAQSLTPPTRVVLVRTIALATISIVALLGLALAVWPRLSGEKHASPAERPTIAVLPFANLSGDASNQSFVDGLTEELIHGLASVSGLRVVSRTSSMQFRDTQESAPEIAAQLGVEYLLEGAVLAVDDEVRISAQLIRPASDEHLFSRSYDRKIENILALHRTVAADVVRETRAQLTEEESQRLSRQEQIDPVSYRQYLLAMQSIQNRTPEDLLVAIRELTETLERSPDFALAWAALADARFLSVGYLQTPDGYDAAEETANTALALDPGLAQPHATLGTVYTGRDQDWDAAEASFLRAIALEPSYATAHQWYSEHLSLSGRHAEAVAQVQLALELDPLSPLMHAAAGQRLSAAKRYEEAVAEFRIAEALGARFLWLYRDLGYSLTRLGRIEEAVAAHREDFARQAWNEELVLHLDAAIEESGVLGLWQWAVRQLEEAPAPSPYQLAEAYAAAGRKAEALKWLELGLKENVMWFLQLQRTPAFDALRNDPDYLQLVGHLPLWTP